MKREVNHENTAFLHRLLDVAQAQQICDIPAHAGEHDQRLVMPFEDHAQHAIDQTLAEFKLGPDRRSRLMKQNLGRLSSRGKYGATGWP
ncbi:hypothetical protein [Rhodoferax sp.]|uniref:hypothetical protein n=1 Tax=Rhodoferax sp. TaxID=50421 RepID=UPI0026244C5D|nr:hypothetical protein [Rhodoferax sp.]MDD3937598.1 hypothetical protein [Rhodoferax sp.]